jgi:hypothetical protein
MNRKLKGLGIFAVCAIAGLALMALIDAKAGHPQFTGYENHAVSLEQAVKFVQNFRTSPTAPGTQGGFFGKETFEKILAQPGCVGIRYYYAKQDDGSPALVLVGVDAKGDDMEQGLLAEMALPCPPYCGSPSRLNK